ncbi:hypothetical protein [Methanobrevibacter sp.]
MINEVIISRLDELIGDYNTPFFNYLLYSYDLSLDECEDIIDNLKKDINSNKLTSNNIVTTLEDYFRMKVLEGEKTSKANYLIELINPENEFYSKYLEKYELNESEIDLIYNKVKSKIMADNITDFEIKRYLEYYFANMVKQKDYMNDLDWIVGRNYDTLIIRRAKRENPILLSRDIVNIVMDIREDILDAVEFREGIKKEFLKRCMLKSEDKKARALSQLEMFVEGSGDSFLKLVDFKGLSKSDGETIITEIKQDIADGLVQPERLDSVFLTNRFNEYNERK